MAADDAAKDAPDPWDDIVAGLSETAGELSFNFDQPGQDDALTPEDANPAAADAFGMHGPRLLWVGHPASGFDRTSVAWACWLMLHREL